MEAENSNQQSSSKSFSRNQDAKHTNEFGEIEAFRNTKYWFKKDIKTIKGSLIATIKLSPLVFLTTFVFSF